MKVGKLKEWLADKDDDRRLVWAYNGKDISFEDIALTVEKKPKQGELFSE